MSRAAFLWNPNNASHAAYLDEWKAVAQLLGVELLFVAVRSSDEFDTGAASRRAMMNCVATHYPGMAKSMARELLVGRR
jgi:hypothetical protein